MPSIRTRTRLGVLEKRKERQQRHPRRYLFVARRHALSFGRVQERRKGIYKTRAIGMEKQIPECCVFRFKFRPIQKNTAPIGAVFFFRTPQPTRPQIPYVLFFGTYVLF